MSALSVHTYLSPYKPIPASVDGWDPQEQATWPATTATLIGTADDALLVDALMTKGEGEALAAWIPTTGLRHVSTVYVTHAHADHFFGATTLLEHLNGARMFALPEVAAAAQDQVTPELLQVWNTFFAGQVPAGPAVPEPLDRAEILVGGHLLSAVPLGQIDVPSSTAIHDPDTGLVVCGDVAYNGIHMWLQGSTVDSRAAWLATLDAIEDLDPRSVIAGHKDPGAPDDHAARVLDLSRGYLADFDAAVAADPTPNAVIEAMLRVYPDFGNRYTLWLAAHSQVGV